MQSAPRPGKRNRPADCDLRFAVDQRGGDSLAGFFRYGNGAWRKLSGLFDGVLCRSGRTGGSPRTIASEESELLWRRDCFADHAISTGTNALRYKSLVER